MHSHVHVAAALAVAIVLVAGLGAAPARAAAPDLKITPGGNFTGTGKLAVTANGDTFDSCTSSIAGTFKSGTIRGTEIGVIRSVKPCTGSGPLGLTFKVKFSAAAGNPWPMDARSFRSGVISGNITNVEATISGTGCSASVAGTSATSPGSVPFTFNGHILKISRGGDLHTFNVNGCFGLVANGDPVGFSASYAITPAQTITSP